MFIVLEGLDGAGKSTQINYLQDFFLARNVKSRFIHFPRFDTPVYGPLIAQFLRGELGDVDQVSPRLAALLYAGDRHHAAPQIETWQSRGFVVIADRYVYSNIAYQCAKIDKTEEQSELRNWILQMEYEYFNIPKPDLNLFLDVPLEFVAEKLRMTRHGDDRGYLKGKFDIHESNLSLQERVREVYLKQSDLDPQFSVIPCVDMHGAMLPAHQISTLITQKLKTFNF